MKVISKDKVIEGCMWGRFKRDSKEQGTSKIRIRGNEKHRG
jgi:hypothetical protein